MTGRDDEFVEFARVQAAGLRRTAYLMCHDWHLAQDLTQTALAKLYVAWGRLDWLDNPMAYAKKVLLRTFLDHQRRRGSHEVAVDSVPDSAHESDPELRLTLLDALAQLPPRDRAIVVLRYWEDYSIDAVADVVGVSTAVVKSQSMRSLAKLRVLLGEDLFT
ncbi:MAG TPA: SigE family RNA polymerase sigma factor [Pseudonocardiaceae bacterium]|nr:SigE family RNA polymerase sigma factor [Pseudonocardiaceae bacterium]